MRVGVLALQGGVREHANLLAELGAEPVLVRRPDQLRDLDALVLPGGESSVIDRLARSTGLFDPLRRLIADGLPTLATCAGLILLAQGVLDPAPGQQSLGVLDVDVRRNAFGPQLASAEVPLATRWGWRRWRSFGLPRSNAWVPTFRCSPSTPDGWWPCNRAASSGWRFTPS
ncbi:MAG: pyridoxal 5'-phosphate synthase glutaminase subunit PdxT [Micropruina glycogenica]